MAHAFDHPLEDEIEFGDVVITTFVFRKPWLDDFDQMAERMEKGVNGIRAFKHLVSALTGQPLEVIARTGTADMAAIQTKLAPFLPAEDGKGTAKSN